MIQYWITLIDSLLLFMMIIFRNSIRDKVLQSMIEILSDDILESLYKLRIRESAQLKTVLELYNMEIHHKITMPSSSRSHLGPSHFVPRSLRSFASDSGSGNATEW